MTNDEHDTGAPTERGTVRMGNAGRLWPVCGVLIASYATVTGWLSRPPLVAMSVIWEPDLKPA
jgi:hypothetical protein